MNALFLAIALLGSDEFPTAWPAVSYETWPAIQYNSEPQRQQPGETPGKPPPSAAGSGCTAGGT